MPQNGDISTEFGTFRSLCCGSEIVIPKSAVFPDCPNHPRLPTVWKPLPDEKIRHVSELFPKKKSGNDTAA